MKVELWQVVSGLAISLITGYFGWLTARSNSKSSIESTYIAEMKVIIENYKEERSSWEREKKELQKLVDEVRLINEGLKADNAELKRENLELKTELKRLRKDGKK